MACTPVFTRLDVKLMNEGWARPYNLRRLQLVLTPKAGGKVYRFTDVHSDARQWLPGGAATIPLRIVVPSSMEAGDYDVALAMPDADAKLAQDPRFSIRFANADDWARRQRWDAGIGAFYVGARVSVQ